MDVSSAKNRPGVLMRLQVDEQKPRRHRSVGVLAILKVRAPKPKPITPAQMELFG